MPRPSAQSHSSVIGICHKSWGTKGCWKEAPKVLLPGEAYELGMPKSASGSFMFGAWKLSGKAVCVKSPVGAVVLTPGGTWPRCGGALLLAMGMAKGAGFHCPLDVCGVACRMGGSCKCCCPGPE